MEILLFDQGRYAINEVFKRIEQPSSMTALVLTWISIVIGVYIGIISWQRRNYNKAIRDIGHDVSSVE